MVGKGKKEKPAIRCGLLKNQWTVQSGESRLWNDEAERVISIGIYWKIRSP